MAKLCASCQEKKPDTSVRGTCQAGSHVQQSQLPSGHLPWTDSLNFTLCDTCAEHFSFCAWCWGPLHGHPQVTVPTDKQFLRVFEQDNGSHQTGMYVGEQVLVQFTIDRFSGMTWDVLDLSNGVRHVASRMVTEGGGQYATLEMYFDLNKSDPDATIELEQVSSSRWASVSNPKTFKVTVEVKQ